MKFLTKTSFAEFLQYPIRTKLFNTQRDVCSMPSELQLALKSGSQFFGPSFTSHHLTT